MEIRLQKYFTDCGILSRRAAEAEIAAGRVKVNGTVAEVGQKIDPERDTVIYKGKKIEPSKDAHKVCIMLHKPRGYVTTTNDEKGRPCVTDLVSDVGTRVYPIGRLDLDSDGLLLLTNDGELANFLTHPKHTVPKIYHVKIKGVPTREELWEIGKPIEIDGMVTKKVDVKLISTSRDDTSVLEMVLFEGRNRQIRRMCEARGVEIVRLTRVAIGDIKLGNLAPGKWRHLTASQIKYLRSEMKKHR